MNLLVSGSKKKCFLGTFEHYEPPVRIQAPLDPSLHTKRKIQNRTEQNKTKRKQNKNKTLVPDSMESPTSPPVWELQNALSQWAGTSFYPPPLFKILVMPLKTWIFLSGTNNRLWWHQKKILLGYWEGKHSKFTELGWF